MILSSDDFVFSNSDYQVECAFTLLVHLSEHYRVSQGQPHLTGDRLRQLYTKLSVFDFASRFSVSIQ